jgi:DNA-directed RNA polymerase specialized sigma24 family protein
VRVQTVDRKPDTSAIDERFVRAIYDDHRPLLLRYVTAITHDRHAAEDVVQETSSARGVAPAGWRATADPCGRG